MSATAPIRTAFANTAALALVRDGVAAAWRAASAAIPDKLTEARARWREAHGAIGIVAHRALSRLSEEAGSLLAHAESVGGDVAGSRALAAPFFAAGEAILGYMDDLAAGKPERPMRLLPALRALAAARGASAAGGDLFFPDLRAPAPSRPPATPSDPETLREARRRFEAALLKWLRHPAKRSVIKELRIAVREVEASRALAGARAGWLAALSVVEALKDGGLAPDAELKRFLGQLNQQLGRTIDGADELPEPLHRQALYLAARATKGALADSLKAAYGLEALLVEEAPVTAAVSAGLAGALKKLGVAWGSWASGEGDAAALAATLDAADAHCGPGPAGALARETCAVMREQLSGGGPDAAPALEVSCALLMLENLVEDPARAAQSFTRRAANASARLRASCETPARLAALPPMELLDPSARRAEARSLLVQTLVQAGEAIAGAERALESFFADPGARAGLAAADRPLAQTAGMFAMVQDPGAAAVLEDVRADIAALAAGGVPGAEAKDRVARRVTALASYVEASRRGPADLGAILGRAGLGAAIEGEGVDREMLEVFLEEAAQVLEAIEAGLPESRHAPADQDRLTVLQRAFHTLKGSGRMVGLHYLGEVAWEVERTFNHLAQSGDPGSPGLYRLVAEAHESMASWIASLRASGRAAVDGRRIADWARMVRAGEALADGTPAPAAADPAPGNRAATLKLPSVKIGATEVSPVLFGIFLEEARGHVGVLEDHARRLATESAVAASAAFLRAAHTLGGIAATVGFPPISDLAGSLERTLLGCGNAGASLDDAARADISRAVERLARMVAEIAERRAPEAAPALVDALDLTVKTRRVEAVVPAEPAADRRSRRLADDLDPELLEIFLTETQELLPQVGQDLRDWRARPQDKLVPQSLKRLLHTLKGSSRMAGAMALGELTHRMETRVENAALLVVLPEGLFDELDASYDRLGDLVEQLQGLERGAAPPQSPVPATGRLTGAMEAMSARMAAATLTGKFRALPPPAESVPTAPAVPAVPAAPEGPALRAMLRVRAEAADLLANEAGEVAIARARAETELRGVRGALRELTDNIIRLRTQLREVEVQAETQMQSRAALAQEAKAQFDPLEFDRFTRLQELTRLMAESVNDVATVQQNLMRNLDEGEAALAAQARTTRKLQDELLRIRMVPFASMNDRLYRVARLAARDAGKRVNMDIRGGQAELDRGVLDRIVAPLEHLLRNCVAHGIESTEARKSAGKREAGEIVVGVRQEGNDVVLGVADDGAGLDLARIRAKARAQGLVPPDAVLDDAQVADLIFRAGFSTAEGVSELAGRGIGMDVVRTEIAALGGRVELDFERGKGTRFTIYLPLTLAVLKAVVLRAAGQTYAVPSLLVEQVQSLKPEVLAAARAAGEIEWQGTRYPLHYLPRLLGDAAAAAPASRFSPVLLLRSGPHRAAVQVDALAGGQEIVVKNVGPQLARVPGVTGAAVLASGDTVLILNPAPLAQRAAQQARSEAAAALAATKVERPAAAAPAARRRATILVVDDSLTVRKITGRALAREGYVVVVAKDGVEALEKMRDTIPDVVVTDVEMPRMDGFDLTRNVRADSRLNALPVIMITSRTAEKHRNHAAELGVNVFLGKPYEERELLEHIAGFVHAGAGA